MRCDRPSGPAGPGQTRGTRCCERLVVDHPRRYQRARNVPGRSAPTRDEVRNILALGCGALAPPLHPPLEHARKPNLGHGKPG